MIDAFRIWLIGLMSAAAILTVLSALIPEGSVKRIAGITGGLVLLLTLLRGLVRLDLGSIRLSYDSCADRINRQIESYQDKSRTQLESLIAQRTAAYISEQARFFGLTCTPGVQTRWTADNIPVPDSVTMDIPFHAELSKCMENDLGIDAAKQIWSASEG